MTITQKNRNELPEFHDGLIDRSDLFTLIALVAALVVVVLMIHWLSGAMYKSFRNIEINEAMGDETARADVRNLSSSSESEAMEVKMERPWHTSSQPDKICSYRDAAAGRSMRYSEADDEAVLNIVWEQTPYGLPAAAGQSHQGLIDPQCVGKRDLISSIPMTVKKPLQSGNGYVVEPVPLKVYLEPVEIYGTSGDAKKSSVGVMKPMDEKKKISTSQNETNSVKMRSGEHVRPESNQKSVNLAVDQQQSFNSKPSMCVDTQSTTLNKIPIASEASSTISKAQQDMNSTVPKASGTVSVLKLSKPARATPTEGKGCSLKKHLNSNIEAINNAAVENLSVKKDTTTSSLSTCRELRIELQI